MADLPTSREVKQRLNSEDSVIPLSEVRAELNSKGIFSQSELNNQINPGSIFSRRELDAQINSKGIFPMSEIQDRVRQNRAPSNPLPTSPSQSSLSKKENDIRLKQSQSFIGSSNDPFSNPGRDNYQTYPYDYYAGTDCKIFFGDIWVDDIITIQYTCEQSKTPIYGYASQNFDAIAKGQIIVQGSLAIAFKETGYLNIIQATLEAQRADATQIIKAKIDEYQTTAKAGLARYVPGLNVIGDAATQPDVSFTYSPNGTPQIIRQQQTIESILVDKKSSTSLAVSKTIGVESKSRDFEDFAEILEDSIWGDSNGKAFSLENKLKRADEFDYNPNGGITTAKGRSYSDVLNIMLTFGDINDYRAEHTITVLNDVHFISTSMVVSPNGDPIGEIYNFIARDINDSINTTSNTVNINPIKLNVGNDSIKISKIEDANKIEQFLNKPMNEILIDFEAALGPDGWNSYPGEITMEYYPSKIEPFVDALCKKVEQTINQTYVPEVVDTKNSQYIIKLILNEGTGSSDLTMILEQSIPGTRSYKVISPVRSGFGAVNLVSRDDLLKAKAMKPPVQKAPKASANSTKQKSMAAAEAAAQVTAEEQAANSAFVDQYAIDPAMKAKVDETRAAPNRNRTLSSQDVQEVNKQWGPMIADAQKTLGSSVPTEFVAAIIAQESAGNPNAVSYKRDANGNLVKVAEGLTQMIPSTYGAAAEAISTKYPGALTPVVGVYSPKNAILAATYELDRLYKATGGDLEKTAAAYNAGLGALKQSKDDPRYSIYENPNNKGYKETRAYVPSVMAGYNQISTNKDFNFSTNFPMTSRDVIETNPSESAKKEAAATLQRAGLNPAEFVGDTVVKFPSTLKDEYPNAPEYVKISAYKNLQLNDPTKNTNYATGGFLDTSRGKPKDTAYIGLDVTRGDAPEVLAHELQHVEQFNASKKSIEETRNRLFSGPYKTQKGEIEARKVAAQNDVAVYDDFGNLISKYWK